MTVSEKWLDGVALRRLVDSLEKVLYENGAYASVKLSTLLAEIGMLRQRVRESALEEGFTISK